MEKKSYGYSNPEAPGGKASRREGLALALPLGLAAYFLWRRWHAAGFPSGDEGSWMAVAAQLARGEGFTTRWLEHHWLTPYALPRPDDFRYPGLTVLLGAAFRIFGIAYSVALASVGGLFLAFIASVYFSLRKWLGFWPAYAASVLTACSLLQLQWSSSVYTEGLFGIVLGYWVHLACQPELRRQAWSWWVRMGLCVGALYLVRPNGLLLYAGVLGQFAWDRRHRHLPWNRLLAATTACGLLILPWLIRNALWFGNPLHIAGSAGLLRDRVDQSHNLGAAQYFSLHSAWFPVTRMAVGAVHFFSNLHFFEHGLELLPLAGLLAGCGFPVLRRQLRLPVGLSLGFLVSFLACVFASWNSWAGVRYFSGYLPFVYAVGIFYGTRWFSRPLWRAAALAWLLLPVVNPHRFYERQYRQRKSAGPEVSAYVDRLEKLTPPEGLYYAKSLGQLNFLTDRRCVGLQELYDSTWYFRSEKTFHPRLMALRRGEDTTADIREALGRYRSAGFALDTLATLDSTWFLRLTPPWERNHPPNPAMGRVNKRMTSEAATPLSAENPKKTKPRA